MKKIIITVLTITFALPLFAQWDYDQVSETTLYLNKSNKQIKQFLEDRSPHSYYPDAIKKPFIICTDVFFFRIGTDYRKKYIFFDITAFLDTARANPVFTNGFVLFVTKLEGEHWYNYLQRYSPTQNPSNLHIAIPIESFEPGCYLFDIRGLGYSKFSSGLLFITFENDEPTTTKNNSKLNKK